MSVVHWFSWKPTLNRSTVLCVEYMIKFAKMAFYGNLQEL